MVEPLKGGQISREAQYLSRAVALETAKGTSALEVQEAREGGYSLL
jgi:hypothetical protein